MYQQRTKKDYSTPCSQDPPGNGPLYRTYMYNLMQRSLTNLDIHRHTYQMLSQPGNTFPSQIFVKVNHLKIQDLQYLFGILRFRVDITSYVYVPIRLKACKILDFVSSNTIDSAVTNNSKCFKQTKANSECLKYSLVAYQELIPVLIGATHQTVKSTLSETVEAFKSKLKTIY